jgi:parallel beta-helix repeat protein
LLSLLLLLGSAAAARAQFIIYVPCDTAACPERILNIQSGIKVSASNGGPSTIILVTSGYTNTGEIDFPSFPLTIKCNGAPGSCGIEGSGSPFAVNFANGVGRDSVLDGFVISDAGFPYEPYQIIIPGQFGAPTITTHRATGGISISGGSSPTIKNNTISYNACGGIVSVDSFPLIQNNVISNSEPQPDGGLAALGTCFNGSWNVPPPPINLYPNYGFPSTPIWLAFSADTPPPMPAIVSGNTIENNTFYSIQAGVPVGTINVYFDDNTSQVPFYYYSPFPLILRLPLILHLIWLTSPGSKTRPGRKPTM